MAFTKRTKPSLKKQRICTIKPRCGENISLISLKKIYLGLSKAEVYFILERQASIGA